MQVHIWWSCSRNDIPYEILKVLFSKHVQSELSGRLIFSPFSMGTVSFIYSWVQDWILQKKISYFFFVNNFRGKIIIYAASQIVAVAFWSFRPGARSAFSHKFYLLRLFIYNPIKKIFNKGSHWWLSLYWALLSRPLNSVVIQNFKLHCQNHQWIKTNSKYWKDWMVCHNEALTNNCLFLKFKF